jgi:phage-related protein
VGVLAEEAVRITADTKGFHNQVETGVTGSLKKAAVAAGGIFAAVEVGKFLGEAVSGAAQLEVSQRRVSRVFGESAEGVHKFAEDAAQSYGISAAHAEKYLGVLGQTFTSMGIGKKASADMSVGIVKASADLASFSGQPVDKVFTALQKGTLGATRGLKAYGINISQADVANKALALGLIKPIHSTAALQSAQVKVSETTKALSTAIKEHGKGSDEAAKATAAHSKAEESLSKAMDGTVPKLTTAQKAQASYAAIMDAASVAQGNFGKHTHDLGEEQQILGAQFDNIKDKIGLALLPIVTKILGVFMDAMPAAIHAAGVAVDWLKARFEEHRAEIMNVVNAITGALSAAFAYFTNTVIPAALAAWNKYGPKVKEVFDNVVIIVTTEINIVRTIITTIIDQIRAHWDQIWSVFGPVVTAAFTIIKTLIAADLKIIADAIAIFAALLQGNWGKAWNALKDLLSTALNAAVTVLKTILTAMIAVAEAEAKLVAQAIWEGIKGVGSLLAALAGVVGGAVGDALRSAASTAGRLAGTIATAIWNGVKTVGDKLGGLAGIVSGGIKDAASTAAGSAFSYMRQVGFAIADGVISGIGNLASRVASAVGNGAKNAVGGALSLISSNSPSKLFRETVGFAIGEGVVAGTEDKLALLGPAMGTSLKKVADNFDNIVQPLLDKAKGATGKVAAALVKEAQDKAGPVGDAFQEWIKNAQAKVDAQVTTLQTKLSAQMATAQAKIEAWKAKATPTEALLAAQQAKAAQAQVDLAVTAAQAALDGLKVKQAKDWADLMATQAANMASLHATLISSRDDAVLAGNTFNKNIAQSDPGAQALIAAQKNFDATKTAFDNGTASQEQFVAAADALDAQKLANAENTNALTLLDQYNTWQSALAQEAAAGGAITAQDAADGAARQALADQQNADTLAAQKAKDDAVAAQQTYALQLQAAAERVARDQQAADLNKYLVARYARIQTHLDNVRDQQDAHFAELARHANQSGDNLINALSNGIRGAMPTLNGALTAIAASIKSYLKVSSPTEKGPMSDLDQWWTNLGPTLVDSFDGHKVKQALTDAVTPYDASSSSSLSRKTASPQQRSRVEHWLEQIHKEVKGSGATGRGGTAAPIEVHVVGGVGIDASVYRSRR